MDRIIVYPGSIPLDTDILATNRNTMLALGALIQATFGGAPVVDGLAVTPTAPASMNVQIGPGSLAQIATLDPTSYGTLGGDTQHACVKMGINIGPVFVTLYAPATVGTSMVHLIEAQMLESDSNPVVLPYYNPANPAQAWLGAANNGVAQATRRAQTVVVQSKPGGVALTGTQTAPAVDAGWVALATVTVAYGATQVAAGQIVPSPTLPQALFKLPALRPGFSAVQTFASSGIFTVPQGVTRARITVIGAGGAGGLHQTLPSGGGGAGGRAIKFVDYLIGGTQIPVTVGAGGAARAAGSYGQGNGGGTSSFGTIVSATGGQGGAGGTVLASCAGGPGGIGIGGDVNETGSYGTDAIMMTGRGGDGGGPGAGRGASSYSGGLDGQGYGGGAGGGGSSAAGGGGVGAPGGTGAPGYVFVEF